MKILRTSFALAALTFVALPFAGCLVPSDESHDPAPVAEAAQAVQQDLTTVAAIQADPAFNAFYQLYREVSAPLLRRAMSLPPPARAQLLSGLSAVHCSSAGCPELTQYLVANGIQLDLGKVNQVVVLKQQLRARGATDEELVHAMVNSQGIQYQLHPLDPATYPHNTDYDGCLQDCELEFDYAAYAALSGAISALALCTAATAGLGTAVCVVGAFAGYAVALLEADRALESCKERCDSSCGGGASCGGSSSTLNQSCNYDTDCAAAEHCSLLLQAVGGPGKCKSDFHDGHTCVRNAWCTSGNCSWYLCKP